MKKMNIINKEYLLGLLFLAGLTGCSSDDSNDSTTPEEQGTPIAFMANQSEEEPATASARSTGEEMMTRGTSLHDALINEFTVWGYKNMAFSTGVYGG